MNLSTGKTITSAKKHIYYLLYCKYDISACLSVLYKG